MTEYEYTFCGFVVKYSLIRLDLCLNWCIKIMFYRFVLSPVLAEHLQRSSLPCSASDNHQNDPA